MKVFKETQKRNYPAYILVTIFTLISIIIPIFAKSQNRNVKLADFQTHPYANYIQELVENKIVSGYPDGTFKPDASLTRGELTKFIVNAFPQLNSSNSDFDCQQFGDVPKKHTFYDNILQLKCQEIITGTDINKFEPEKMVSKAEASKIIINVSRKIKPEIFPNFYYLAYFKDLEPSNQFFEPIMSAYSHQLINGQKEGFFNPNQAITRGQTSKMIAVAKKLENGPSVIRTNTQPGVKFNTLGHFWTIEVNLQKGGQIDFLTGPIHDYGSNQGVFGGNNPSFTRQTMEQYWKQQSEINPNLFAIFNGGYFRNDTRAHTELALPLKIDNQIVTDGYASTTEFIGQKEVLQIFNNQAQIIPFKESDPFTNISAPKAITSFIEQSPRSSASKVGRVYAGIQDRDQNGNYEIVHFLFSKNATQDKMRIVMNYLGAQYMTMLDGGLSTQLVVEGQDIISSNRTIPQVILISSNPG